MAEEEAEAEVCSLVGVSVLAGAPDERELDMDVARRVGYPEGEVVRRSDETIDRKRN